MKKIKAIIVDDEASAVETLRGMLGTFCLQVEILAEAHSIEDALLAVQQHQPDVVFLDIEMPPFCKGFDLLKLTPNRSFGIIFTTAYPQYAIQAINDAQPWGYLLKPFRVADLVQAVLVVEEKLIEDKTLDKTEPTEQQGIIIPDSRKGNMVIHSKDILYCQADGSTTDIFLLRSGKVEKITASFLLKEVEAFLPSNVFCRTHHSYIVNLQHIVRYKRRGRNGIIFLPQNHQVDISVQKMGVFETQFRKVLHKGL